MAALRSLDPENEVVLARRHSIPHYTGEREQLADEKETEKRWLYDEHEAADRWSERNFS